MVGRFGRSVRVSFRRSLDVCGVSAKLRMSGTAEAVTMAAMAALLPGD